MIFLLASYLTNCLIPSDKHNLIMAKTTEMIFSLLDGAQPDRFLLAYHSMHNALIIDLPLSSYVAHLSLTTQGVDLQ